MGKQLRFLSVYAALVLAPLLIVSACNSTSSTSSTGPENNAAAQGATSSGDLQIVNVLPAPENTRGGADQLIAEADVLEVDVFQVDDLDRTVRVDSNGRITMPLIGAMPAKGKTIEQLELDLERKYGAKYLQSPEITIFMKESAGLRVTMDGQFVKPGIYSVTSRTTLIQAVALAGGLSSLADERKVYVFRQIGERKLVANFSIRDIRAGKKRDPDLYGGDVIVSFTSSSKVAAQNLREALGLANSTTRVLSPL